MMYAYVRVSSKEQNWDRQFKAVKDYCPLLGEKNIFADKQSGKSFKRPAYEKMKSVLCVGDEVIVKELDRLGRNKEAIKAELQWFKFHGITVRILDVPTTLIDFKDQGWVADMVNNVLIEVMGAVAEQERIKIRQRQKEGIAAAKAKGKTWGHFRNIPDEFASVVKQVDDGWISVTEAVKKLNISRQTWYNWKKECG